MTVFNNASGLTLYALSCGYVQEAESVINGRKIRVTLWMEHGAFHVRAHDFTVEGRLDWVVENSLADARHHYNAMIRRYLGDALTIADRRYKVSREFNGHESKKYVVRFCGEYIGFADDKLSARVKVFNHINKISSVARG